MSSSRTQDERGVAAMLADRRRLAKPFLGAGRGWGRRGRRGGRTGGTVAGGTGGLTELWQGAPAA